jgi:hypothetical protein
MQPPGRANDDGPQPGAESLRITQPGQAAYRDQEGFGRRILRQREIAGHAIRRRPGRTPVPPIQFGYRRRLAALGLFHPVIVFVLCHTI